MSPTVAVISAAAVLGGAVLTGLFALILWWLNRDKTDAETDNQQAQAWGTLTKSQTDWITQVNDRLHQLEQKLEHEQGQRRLANSYARTLARTLEQHNIAVPPAPAGLDID